MDSVISKPVRWLVPGYLPLGKLALIAGDGGHGKSTLTLHIAACLTTARPCFGLDYDVAEACEVLLVSCEDDLADTVRPRLDAAGANAAKVFHVGGLKTTNGKPEPFTLAHVQEIDFELRRRPAIRLVIIDPAGAYIGRTGCDDYSDTDLRSLLAPLAELAADREVTFLLVKHLNKGATAKAVHKVGGSTGYVNTVRGGYLVAPDPEDEERRLFLPLKWNLGPRPKGLAYFLQPLPVEQRNAILEHRTDLGPEDLERLGRQLFHVQWHGEVNIDADSLFAGPKKDRSGGKVEEAGEWLLGYLAGCAVPSSELFEDAKQAGFSRNTVYSAKDKLGKEKVRVIKDAEFQGQWLWGPGDKKPKDWVVRRKDPKPDPS